MFYLGLREGEWGLINGGFNESLMGLNGAECGLVAFNCV